MNQTRLHIKLGEKRTTISADQILVAMLALKLGTSPDDHQAVREWLQARLPDKVGTDKGIGKKASQAARVMMIEAIADKKLSTAYDDWVIGKG
jgi:hypothetical protein